MCTDNRYSSRPSDIEAAKENVINALDAYVAAHFEAIKDACDNEDLDEIESLVSDAREAQEKRDSF